MLPPLEFSVSLWWVATPLWGPDESESGTADESAPLTELGTSGPLSPAQENAGVAWAGIPDMFAPLASPVATPPLAAEPSAVLTAAPTRMLLKGYSWSTKPVWIPRSGPLWQAAHDARRHDAARRREERLPDTVNASDQVRAEVAAKRV
jgi:hypothetical protein